MKRKGAILAAVLAGVMTLGVTAAGCQKKEEEGGEHTVHTWSNYIADGENGHYRTTTCTGHDPIREENGAHEYDGDRDTTCNVCGYVREIGVDDPEGGETTDPTEPPGSGTTDPEEPVIPKPAAGAPQITKTSVGELESAYVEWTAADDADWYEVYYKSADGGEWKQLDEPLVRQYADYYRVDAVGLKAGTYDMKVVPVGTDGIAAEKYSSVVQKITVYSHDRSGFAFVNGTSSGAYNEDGTIKDNANVIYITDDNKDEVGLTLNGVKLSGLQNILNAQKKAATPLAVRMIGNIGSPAIDGKNNTDANTLLVKEITSGVTIEGIGNDATVNGWTLRLVSNDNVEVRNLGFMNTRAAEPDNLTLEKNSHIWVHNCDLFYGGAGGDSDQAKGDGALDTKTSTYITHSYNHFWDSGKCNLQNMKESGDFKITYHHNWYDHSDSRHPRIRTATVHVYNNYFDGNAKYGVGVTYGASAFVENNYFRSTATMRPMLSSKQGTDALGEGTFSGENGGIIKAFGNYFDCTAANLKLITQNTASAVNDFDCYEVSSRDEQVPASVKTLSGGTTYNNFDTAEDMYEYTADTAEKAREKVERYAGRVDGGDFKWTFDNSVEDANYSIITELKTALTKYSGKVVKVGNIEVTGGGQGGSDDTPDVPPAAVEGEISFIPTASGSGFTVSGTTKSHTAITVGGVDIAKNSALKLNSSGKVVFETVEEMTLTLYLLNEKTVKIDGAEKTPSSGGNCYIVTLTLSAGEHTVVQGNGENSLYLIKLSPVS